jgi:hypothetical protein
VANVTASIKTSTVSTQTTTLPGTVTNLTVNQNFNANYQTPGVAADQVNLNYVASLSLAATPTTLDLTALTDRYGGSVNFVRVRSVTIKNKNTTDGQTVTVKPGATNGWMALLGTGSTLILQPSSSANDGGVTLSAPNTTGWVVSGTSKTLTLDPGANIISVDIEINGCNA